jgi:hypothetical protein
MTHLQKPCLRRTIDCDKVQPTTIVGLGRLALLQIIPGLHAV